MPGFDRTGPEGKGPMTGKKRGLCEGKNKNAAETKNKENENRGFGKGGNHGKVRGRGRRFGNKESN